MYETKQHILMGVSHGIETGIETGIDTERGILIFRV